MAFRPRRDRGTAGHAGLRQRRPDGKTCAFCPDRLVGKPDHRDPRFLVRSLCARSHRLGAVKLVRIDSPTSSAFSTCFGSPRKSWESYFAPPLHELNLSDATRVFQLNAPVVL